MAFLPSGYTRAVHGHEELINIMTEPPQYLVAQPCMDTSVVPSEVDQNRSTSQIEQIMARYEQLCRKLDQ